ncbi:MAG: hypothetical protein M3P18_25580, partial [Actinomycetota bacterium]|nr:hypothetical protein [Actinomycetota bacterium]
ALESLLEVLDSAWSLRTGAETDDFVLRSEGGMVRIQMKATKTVTDLERDLPGGLKDLRVGDSVEYTFELFVLATLTTAMESRLRAIAAEHRVMIGWTVVEHDEKPLLTFVGSRPPFIRPNAAVRIVPLN